MNGLSQSEVLRAVIREAGSKEGLVVGNYVYGNMLTEENIVVLSALYKLVMQTDYLWTESRMWLAGMRTYRVINETVEQKEKVKPSTARSRIYYDVVKLKKLLGPGLVMEVFNADPERLEEIHTVIKKKLEKYDTNSLIKQLAIKVPEPAGECAEITEREWDELLFICKHYARKRVEFIESKTTPRHMSYLVYLQEHEADLPERQKEKLEQIKKYLL